MRRLHRLPAGRTPRQARHHLPGPHPPSPGGHRRARRLRPLPSPFAHSQYFPSASAPPTPRTPDCSSPSTWPPTGDAAACRTTRKRRDRLEALYGKPKPQAYARALRETLDRLLAKVPQGQRLRLVSDDHKQYALAVSRHPRHERIDHLRLANPRRGPKGSPRSAAARRRDAALATVDFAHQFLRHSLSHQRRETIAFARRHSSLAEQIFTHGVWLNYVKLRAERQPRAGTRAMHAGLSDRPWDWTRILARRLQPFEVDLPPTWEAVYRRRLPFPSHLEVKPHDLKNAF
ncbi:MAG: hypothetical protein Q9Q13_08445 [Acidobacteriota bacterium]|nr:hypothetical protein [Acidobacteriota bacterium]